MANAFNKLLNAAKIAEEGTLGMMGLLQQRDATKAANQLALAKYGLDQETHNLAVNAQQVTAAQSIYEQSTSALTEHLKLAQENAALYQDPRWTSMHNNLSTARENSLSNLQRLIGVDPKKNLSVYDLVMAVRSGLPEDKSSFVDGTSTELFKKANPGFTGDMNKVIEIWKTLDAAQKSQGSSAGSSTAADQKKSSIEEVMGIDVKDGVSANEVYIKPIVDALPSLETIKEIDKKGAIPTAINSLEELLTVEDPSSYETIKSVQDALAVDPDNNPSLLQSILDTMIPPAGAADFISGSDKGKALRKRRSTGMELEPEALLALGMTPLIPAGILAMMNQQGRQRPEVSGVLGTDELPIGMKYRYDPNAPLEDERNLRSASTYGAQARSGSFPIRDDERYPYAFPESQLPFTMPDGETSQLISPSEVEELQLMDKAFGTGTSGLMSLSDELGSGSGGGQVSEEAANFITTYMQILQNSNVDEAGKRTGSAFNLLPVEVQEEVVTILEQSGIGQVNSPIPLGDTGPGIDPNLAEGQRMGGILGMLMSLGYPMSQLGMGAPVSPALAGLAATLAPRTANAPTETGTPLTSEQLQALANQ